MSKVENDSCNFSDVLAVTFSLSRGLYGHPNLAGQVAGQHSTQGLIDRAGETVVPSTEFIH